MDKIGQAHPGPFNILCKIKLLYQQGRIQTYLHEPCDPSNPRKSSQTNYTRRPAPGAAATWKNWVKEGVKALNMDPIKTDLTDPARVEATLRRTIAKCNVKAMEMYNLEKHMQNIRKSPRNPANS